MEDNDHLPPLTNQPQHQEPAPTDGGAAGATFAFRGALIPRGWQWLECLVLAALYFGTARLGQLFAVHPGNVTPVWLPSGFILAAVVIRGRWIWPGIWLGAFVGNVWAYIDFTDIAVLIRAFIAGSLNGTGDVLCALIGHAALARNGGTVLPHERMASVWRFTFHAAVLGSLVSAVFGVGGLTMTGVVPAAMAAQLGFTWWAGDAVGVLLVGSTLLCFCARGRHRERTPGTRREQAFFWALLVTATAGHASGVELPGGVTFPQSAILLVLAWSTLRFDHRVSYLACFAVGTTSIVMLANGWGAGDAALNVLLIEKQMFVAVLFIMTMALMAAISEHRATAGDLAVARDAAERSNEFKTRFLSTMSHEIRTPLNGVTGMSALLVGTDLDADQRRYALSIQACSQHLLTLTNDVLDLSKVEAGQLQLEPVEFHLREFLDGVGLIFEPGASEKGVELLVEIDEQVPSGLRADPVRLRQILANLLSNAVKYTAEGRITLRVAREGDLMRFDVVDTGTGIASDQLDDIFQEFRQAAHTSEQHGGSGLGLYLSRTLAELMDGELTVESREEEGSTFTLRAPLPGVSIKTELEARADAASLNGHVLVVDDNAVNRRVAQALLERMGCTVSVANDGGEAVERVRDGAFSLVLMDCHMPVMDGFEATRRIRSMTTVSRDMPVLALTASAVPEEHEHCIVAGMDDVLTKPINQATLFQALEPWLAGKPGAISAAG